MTERQTFSVDIWAFQDSLTRRLAWWSMGSLLAGAWMVWVPPLLQDKPALHVLYNPFVEYWRGMGIQFLTWGGIDLAIAVFGALGMRRRKARLTSDELFSTQPKERANLAKILWINTGLDILYVAGGLALLLTLGASDPFWRGGGWGMVIQGGFLFIFDLFHALKLR